MKYKNVYTFLFIVVILMPGCSQLNNYNSRHINHNICGYSIGDTICNIKLWDQYGFQRALGQFYGLKVIQFSTMWCMGCAIASKRSVAIKNLYGTQINYITVLIEPYTVGAVTTIDDAYDWADQFDITEPVLVGDRSLIDNSEISGFNIDAYPTVYIVDSNNTIIKKISSSNELTDYLKHTFNREHKTINSN